MQRYTFLLSLIFIILASCIGTDFVDEPLGPVPARLELSHAAVSLLEGESLQLSVKVIASDESELNTSVNWSSRNTSVANVDANGLLTAVAAGQAWVDASSQTLNDSLLVTVSIDPESLASITIAANETNLTIGDTLQLAVELRATNGSELNNKIVSWESSQPEICSVDDNGQVIALANGTTQITATSEGIKSLPYALEVGADTLSLSGGFRGLNGYSVEGTAILQRTGDQAVLIFDDDFRSQNGPGLFVYLSPNETNVTGGVSLGDLKATSGSQTYDIPDNVDLDAIKHVLVYCQPFRVPFGTAAFE